ncbi:hypothetical protein GF357_01675 [Candidatus Dojkabacteria bacterium]|nr:hypothetical protein [Candidatus Dojkabacteria bacterium]
MKIDFEIAKQLEKVPRSYGIYKFFDVEAKILYIGKANNLKSRVTSYFQDEHLDRPTIIPMIPLIAKIQTIETANEIEALILEAALIKQYNPPYNIMLKDDKSYAWIYISNRKKIPQVKVVRSINKNEYKSGRLFGPYPRGNATKRLFSYIRKLYPFCNCKNDREELLYYQMGLCPGPNIGKVSPEEYKENIRDLIKFLSGRKKSPIKDLEKKMKSYAADNDFEKAAELRDRINDIKYLTDKLEIGYVETEQDFLKKQREIFKQEITKLSSELGYNAINRIECYDISNIQGKLAYGSMVVYQNGQIRKDHYRIFKIRTIKSADDPKMLHETVSRRLKHVAISSDDESLNSKPDLILIDGGKTQLSALDKVVPGDILLLGITKGRKYKRKGKRQKDEFWLRKMPNSNNQEASSISQIKLKNIKILVNLRDEAHRFAVKHHRIGRKLDKQKSILDSIPGVGPVRKKKLLKKFGSVKNIAAASFEEINSVINDTGVSLRVVKMIR